MSGQTRHDPLADLLERHGRLARQADVETWNAAVDECIKVINLYASNALMPEAESTRLAKSIAKLKR